MNSTLGRWWKQWPIEAEKDGRAVLRIDGVLYDREVVRIPDGDQLPFLLSELGRKYLQRGAPLSPEEQEQALAAGLKRIAVDLRDGAQNLNPRVGLWARR